ncbi:MULTISPECIES: hypothetical protein [unclassified Streptomyces]|uniref:hypothetical protein n=1 Tax=unclassified Streptomyces TaxID=2593676 RepID=UPI0033D94AD6
MQLNTKIVPLLSELVGVVSDDRLMSKREVVEEALMKAYPIEYAQLVAREQASKRARERES